VIIQLCIAKDIVKNSSNFVNLYYTKNSFIFCVGVKNIYIYQNYIVNLLTVALSSITRKNLKNLYYVFHKILHKKEVSWLSNINKNLCMKKRLRF
jgi:hypothetical protein